MTPGEYASVVALAHMARNTLAGLDIAGALDAIARADSLGSILDPTLYRSKSRAMHEDGAVLAAALAFVRATGPRP